MKRLQRLLGTPVALGAAGVLLFAPPLSAAFAAEDRKTGQATASASPAELVDPFVGTLGDFGQLSPAAVSPFGMVQLGPDTSPANHAGYDFGAPLLRGFSHTRGVGVGCGGGGGDMLVMLDYAGATAAEPIDKASERAQAGRYHVTYGKGITADLTATRGAGIIRFHLPRAGKIVLRFDPNNSYARRISHHWLTTGSGNLAAELVSGTVCDVGTYRLFTASQVLIDGHLLDTPMTLGASGIASLALEAHAGETVEVRTGISAVDGEGAAHTRDAELGNRSFEDILDGVQTGWNDLLSRIRLDGATRDEQALFYTALFRVLQTPVAIADPDGRYRGSDGVIGHVVNGHQHYASWSTWDNYRTLYPLLALVAPERAADIGHSLVTLYTEGKQRWATQTEPFLTVRTEHSGIVLLDYYRKGLLSRSDAETALRGMAAENPTLARKTPDEQIEAAYDDWAIAELAGDLGHAAMASRFHRQALGYRTMWRSVFEHPGADGDVVKARGLYQGTLWQYRWAPVFDLPWLVKTVGPKRFDAQLDEFFARNLFNMTNEPDIQVPYLYAWRGHGKKSEALVHRVLTRPLDHWYTNAGKLDAPWHGRSFQLAPQGFADGMDDDAGAMSAWYVFSVLGLYPMTPGVSDYLAIAPTYRRATIRPSGDEVIVIEQPSPAARAHKGITSINGRVLHHSVVTSLQHYPYANTSCTGTTHQARAAHARPCPRRGRVPCVRQTCGADGGNHTSVHHQPSF